MQVRNDLFLVHNARLVHLLAVVAPHDTQQLLQPSLEHAAATASSQQVGVFEVPCLSAQACALGIA